MRKRLGFGPTTNKGYQQQFKQQQQHRKQKQQGRQDNGLKISQTG